jgi:hypothetical protein
MRNKKIKGALWCSFLLVNNLKLKGNYLLSQNNFRINI